MEHTGFDEPRFRCASSRLRLKITFTKSLGGFVGRFVPGVDWAVLAYDVEQLVGPISAA